MGEFTMPALGADMTEGTLLRWRVRPGDVVHRGDVIAVIDTAKAEIDAEVFEDGVIDQLLVSEGVRVPVGTPLATVAATAPATLVERPPEAAPATLVKQPLEVASATLVERPAGAVEGESGGRRVRVSPLARRIAAARGVDLSRVRGTGPRGAIVKADVERAAAPAAAASPASPAEPPPGSPAPAAPERDRAAARLATLKETTAALMARSKREVPHYYLALDVDMRCAMSWLEGFNREHAIADRLLPVALLLSAAARAAAAMPGFNGFYRDGEFEPAERVHLGVAIAVPGGGVIAPALLDADRASAPELMRRLRDLVRRSRAGGLRASELSAGTLTVTSLGDQGATSVYGVIYPPQVALVGFGRVAELPWAEDGMLGARRQVTATLAADHRVSSGHDGAAFLRAIADLLQRPGEI